MHYLGFGQSDRGRQRPVNEDVVVNDANLGLWVVCDGMGGHAGGDLAAGTAARTVFDIVRANHAKLTATSGLPTQREQAVELMRHAALEACRTVFELIRTGRGRPGMGTTLTALLTLDHLGVMAHVGDSRLYLCRGGSIHQLSDDHTIAAELIRRGGMSKETAHSLNMGKALSRAIGPQPTVEVDSLAFDILPEDTFLLCSDGLTRYLSGLDEVGQYLTASRLETVPRLLIDMANQRGGRDNVSVVVVRAQPDSSRAAAEQAHKTEVITRLQALRHVSLFHHLTLKELVQVMNRTTRLELPKGQTVIREGDPGDGMFVIVTGSASVTRGGSELAVLDAGTHFGEMALLNDKPRSATVTTREATHLMQMDRSAFTELLQYHSSLAVKLLWTFAQVLSSRLDEASEHIFNVAPTQAVGPEMANEIRERARRQLGDGWRWG